MAGSSLKRGISKLDLGEIVLSRGVEHVEIGYPRTSRLPPENAENVVVAQPLRPRERDAITST